MAFVYIFKVPQGTKQQYDLVIKKLEEAGYANPRGRLYHFAGPMQNGWQVTDIWESKETFDAFQQELRVVLEKLHIPMPEIEASTADIVLDNHHL
ncbi:hypothetical protein HYS00_02980 [Candidatus Microgenomates bacterium]|nr:hypothetical protein [Candidatus Microgenomates bacterium]